MKYTLEKQAKRLMLSYGIALAMIFLVLFFWSNEPIRKLLQLIMIIFFALSYLYQMHVNGQKKKGIAETMDERDLTLWDKAANSSIICFTSLMAAITLLYFAFASKYSLPSDAVYLLGFTAMLLPNFLQNIIFLFKEKHSA